MDGWIDKLEWVKGVMREAYRNMGVFLDDVEDNLEYRGRQKHAMGKELEGVVRELQGACVAMEALTDEDNLYDY